MTYSKPLITISAEPVWWTLLLALFLIPFSMAACSILFSLSLAVLLYAVLRGEPLARPPAYVFWLAAYAALTLISTAFSRSPLSSLTDNRELLVFLLIPVFQKIINTPRRLRTGLAAILISAALSAATGIATAAISGISLDHRIRGFTSHWMTWSGLLMMVFVFFTVWITQTHELRPPRLYAHAAALVLILAAILFSLTRSMWVGLAVSLGFYIIVKRPKLLWGIIPLIVVTWFLLPQSVSNRVRSVLDPADPTNRDRIHMVYTGWRIFLDHPLTGSGPNTIKALYPQYRHPDTDQDNPHLHNNFLQILAERGLPAAFVLLCFFISLLLSLHKCRQKDNPLQRHVAAGAFFMVIAFLVAGMFEYNWGDTEIQFLFLFLITLPSTTAWDPDAPAPSQLRSSHDLTQASG